MKNFGPKAFHLLITIHSTRKAWSLSTGEIGRRRISMVLGDCVNKFDVLDSHAIHFGEYIMQHHVKFNVTKATVERVIPRNTVALLVKLRDKQNGKILYVTKDRFILVSQV